MIRTISEYMATQVKKIERMEKVVEYKKKKLQGMLEELNEEELAEYEAILEERK